MPQDPGKLPCLVSESSGSIHAQRPTIQAPLFQLCPARRLQPANLHDTITDLLTPPSSPAVHPSPSFPYLFSLLCVFHVPSTLHEARALLNPSRDTAMADQSAYAAASASAGVNRNPQPTTANSDIPAVRFSSAVREISPPTDTVPLGNQDGSTSHTEVSSDDLQTVTKSLASQPLQARRINTYQFEPCSLPASRVCQDTFWAFAIRTPFCLSSTLGTVNHSHIYLLFTMRKARMRPHRDSHSERRCAFTATYQYNSRC